jgi:hypothetical protein
MGRGPESQTSKERKALELAALALGIDVEVLAAQYKPAKAESTEEKMYEAQSVLNYFERVNEFKQIPCRNCGEPFAYDWHFAGVKYCTIHCMRRALEEQGLSWNPDKEPELRWGLSRPAIVPSQVLALLRELALKETVLQESSPDNHDLRTSDVV